MNERSSLSKNPFGITDFSASDFRLCKEKRHAKRNDKNITAGAADTVLLFEDGEQLTIPASRTELKFREQWSEPLLELRCGPVVIEIQDYGFYSSRLQRIFLNEGLEKIGAWAFFGNHNLKELTIPRSVKRIRESAFVSCIGLERVTILSPETELGYNAFRSCVPCRSRNSTMSFAPAGECGRCKRKRTQA